MSYSARIGWMDEIGHIEIASRVPRKREVQARNILSALNVILLDGEMGFFLRELLAQNDVGALAFLRLRILEQMAGWLREDDHSRWIRLMRRLHDGLREQRDWLSCVAPAGPDKPSAQEEWPVLWEWLWVVAVNAYAHGEDSTPIQTEAWINYAGRPDPPNRLDCVIELRFRARTIDGIREFVGAFYRYADPNDCADIITILVDEERQA